MAVVVATDGQSRARGPGSDHLTFNLTDAAKMSFFFYGEVRRRACVWTSSLSGSPCTTPVSWADVPDAYERVHGGRLSSVPGTVRTGAGACKVRSGA